MVLRQFKYIVCAIYNEMKNEKSLQKQTIRCQISIYISMCVLKFSSIFQPSASGKFHDNFLPAISNFKNKIECQKRFAITR